MAYLVLILIIVILLLVLIGVVIAVLHANNKPRWSRGESQLLAQAQGMISLPPARRPGNTCCRQDGPCSAACAHLELAQTITGAVEGVRHGAGLTQLIQLLDVVPPDTLRELIEAEAAAPGRLQQIASRLRPGPSGTLGTGGVPGGRGSSVA